MAAIPLSEVPNAPNAVTPGLETATAPGDQTYRQIRASIDEGGAALHQNVSEAGAPGRAYASIGEDIGKLDRSISEGVGELGKMEKTNALATFNNNYTAAKVKLDEAKSQTDPSQWAILQKQFNDNYGQLTQGISPYGQQMLQSDILHTQASDMVKTGHDAFIAYANQKKQSIDYSVQNFLDRGDYKGAYIQNWQAAQDGLLSPTEKEKWDYQIMGAQQKDGLTQYINQNPEQAKKEIQDALDKNLPMDAFSRITPEELKNYRNVATGVDNYQNTQKINAVGALMDSKNKPPTLEALTKSPEYLVLKPEDQEVARDSYLNKYVAGTPDGDNATLEAFKSVYNYRPILESPDSPWKQYYEISRQLMTVPPSERKPLQDELQKRHDEAITNRLKVTPDQQARDFGMKQLTEMDNVGIFNGPSGDPKDKNNPKQKQAATERLQNYQNVLATFETRMNKEGGGIDHARQVISELTQAPGAASNIPKLKESFSDYLKRDFRDYWNSDINAPSTKFNQPTTNAETENQGSSFPSATPAPAGAKVTNYWPSEVRGSKDGIIGNHDNKLNENSFGVDPETAKELRAAGGKPGDQYRLKLADGTEVTKTWDDTTKGGLKGRRFDFWTPTKGHPKDGVGVASYERINSSENS